MSGKAFLKGDPATEQQVGYEKNDYRGPVAKIHADKDWLYITTDDYAGAAMINIEALSKLRRALARLDSHLNKKPAPSVHCGEMK